MINTYASTATSPKALSPMHFFNLSQLKAQKTAKSTKRESKELSHSHNFHDSRFDFYSRNQVGNNGMTELSERLTGKENQYQTS